LRPSKSVGVDDIPGFIIMGVTNIFVLVLTHIFNSSLFQQYFPTLWKQAAIFAVLKTTTVPLLAITDYIYNADNTTNKQLTHSHICVN
jgi:hypothetical protein